jgi:hypothetical protein
MHPRDLVIAQQRAIAHVASLSSGTSVDECLRVTLNFHPDRWAEGKPLLVALAREGIYRSQFETGTSNGGLTAHPGGDRWLCESRLFGGAYDGVAPQERPKYGALNFRKRAVGGSPRFGSAHLRLTGEVLARTTFCFPDSVFEPVHFGVAERLSLIEIAESSDADLLDDYIEAQVHGPVRLGGDVEALVLDPCFRGTYVEDLARSLPCALEWHVGFRLSTDELEHHPDYRGQEFVELGLKLARDGYLDAYIIGEAAKSGLYDEQSLKRVWHYVARFGGSATAAG